MRKKLNNAAKKVSKAVGAADLVDYAGAKLAKRKLKGTPAAKLVKDTTTAKQASASGAKLAANIASIAALGAAGGTLKAAANAKKAVAKAKVIPKAIKVAGQKKPIKVNNWGNASQAIRKTRKPKFNIKRSN